MLSYLNIKQLLIESKQNIVGGRVPPLPENELNGARWNSPPT